jgi:hypothetical protein
MATGTPGRGAACGHRRGGAILGAMWPGRLSPRSRGPAHLPLPSPRSPTHTLQQGSKDEYGGSFLPCRPSAEDGEKWWETAKDCCAAPGCNQLGYGTGAPSNGAPRPWVGYTSPPFLMS